MMRTSTKLIHVYAELRQALGDSLPAGEILSFAERLVDMSERRNVIDRCGTTDNDHWGCVPLDAAMSDGGWQLYCEQWSVDDFDDEALDRSWQPSTRSPLTYQPEYCA